MAKRIMMSSVPHSRGFQTEWATMRRGMDLSGFIDRSIKPIGACSIVAGISISMVGRYAAADFLIAGGVLFLLASGFADWWKGD